MVNESEKPGVVARMEFNGDTCRLVFEDVSAGPKSASWRHERPYTSKEFERARLIDLKLTKDELAQIGENLVIRLLELSGKL